MFKFKFWYGIFLTQTYAIEDCSMYSLDGSGLNGTFTVHQDGYITGCKGDTGLNPFTFPSNFKFTYKMYQSPTGSGAGVYVPHNSLWRFGTDENNGVLIGCESESKKIRIYNRVNNSNTSQQISTDSYNYNEWVDVTIEYNSGVWKITTGTHTISYSKTFTPVLLHLNAEYNQVKLKEFKIKPL